MKTRALYKYIDDAGIQHTNVVWFGSIGRRRQGFDYSIWDESVFDSDASNFYKKVDNYVDGQQGVAYNLTQRLSIIKGELWYNVKYGLPLFDKYKSKAEFDIFILSQIHSHPDVESIISFKSQIVNHAYSFNAEIQSIYGKLTLESN